MLKDEIVEKILRELKVTFPQEKFYVENRQKENSNNYIVKNFGGELYGNGETTSVIIKSDNYNSVGIIMTWNNEYENIYFTFIRAEFGFVPYKIEITGSSENPDRVIAKICKTADDRLTDFNVPTEQYFYDEKLLIDYLVSAISKWFGCEKKHFEKEF